MKKKIDLQEIQPPAEGRLSACPTEAGGDRPPAPESRPPGGDGFLSGEQVRAQVERVLEGDTEAYRALVENFERAVFSMSMRLLGNNAADAEDLTQESFVRAFEYLPTLEDRQRFGPWLMQIARSLCRDRLRRLETEKRVLQNRAEQLRLEAVPQNGGIASILAQLPPDEYQALKMRYYDKRSYDDIAARLQLTFSQVDHLMRKARARLATRIHLEKNRERSL